VGYLAPLTLPFLTALVASLCLTPLAGALAGRLGIVDHPDTRKIHGRPTPLLGGVAIALALCTGAFASGALGDSTSLVVLTSSAGILLLGICDDCYPRAAGLRWWLRLLYEGCLAGLVVAVGVRITMFGTVWLDAPLTIVWIVGLANAFNLLDNMNGLSAGVAAIAGLTFAVLAARYAEIGPEQLPTARAAAALAGACIGFLPRNIGGRIFMGDAGSLVLGFQLACLAVQGNWRSPTVPTSLIIPLLVLAYPLFDTALVVLLRITHGQSPFVGGRDHSSHRLVRLGISRLETVLLIYLFAASHSLTALLVSSVTFRLSLLALAGSVSVLFIFGMVLRKAPAWGTWTPQRGADHG
jgi:UDP-GlcNAc:undecaprenyl-phosphate/decaprenyl-phosphate GlcNAc-1-phosphate transferase